MANHDLLETCPLYHRSSLQRLWRTFSIPKAFQQRNGICFDDAYEYTYRVKPSHKPSAETKEERQAKFLDIRANKICEKSEVPLDNTRTTVNIKPPFQFLKAALQKLNKEISGSINKTRRPYIQACLKGTSYINNARAHEGPNYVLATDISHFFNHVNRDKVKSQLKKYLSIDGDTADYYARMATCPEDKGSSNYILGKVSLPAQFLPWWPILIFLIMFMTYAKNGDI